MHERVTAAIRAAGEAGRTALIPFITAGYPEPAGFAATLKAVAAVGDVVEVGIPFSDPMADGMTIQRSSFEALRKGVSLRWIFDELEKAGDVGAPLVMMSYLNPLLAFGYEKLALRARQTGVCAFIVPDLPYEECGDLVDALDGEGIGLVQLVTPATPGARLAMLCKASRGFVLQKIHQPKFLLKRHLSCWKTYQCQLLQVRAMTTLRNMTARHRTAVRSTSW